MHGIVNYLYIELKTGNTVSWSIAYGIGLGLDGKETGCNGTSNTDDAWNREIGFNGSGMDFENYFHWNSGTDNTTSNAFATWTGTGRSPTLLPSDEQYMPISSSSSGLYYLEMAISWDAFPRMVNQTSGSSYGLLEKLI